MKARVNRREFLAAGAGLAGTLAVGVALPWRPLHSQNAASLAVPAVDRLKVHVVTDGAHDMALRPQSLPGLRAEYTPPLVPAFPNRTLHSQWGLSLYLESFKGGEQRNHLLDFGFTPEALLNNLELLGLDPGKLHGLIASHGHFDHLGGLTGFLRAKRSALPAEINLYVGGEEVFCQRLQPLPNGQTTPFGTPLDRDALGAVKVMAVMADRPRVLDGHAFTTGPIPRNGFERVLPNTLVEYAKHGSLGCDMSHFLPAEMLGKIVPDQHLGEHATCFNVKGRGLVVITSCGHAGVVNSVRQAQQVSGIAKVHAVLGGVHLFPAPVEYVEQTVLALKELEPDYVIPMHCSGAKFVAAMQKHMPERLVLSSTGGRFTFEA